MRDKITQVKGARPYFLSKQSLTWIASFAVIGVITLLISHAATPTNNSIEPEDGTVAGGAIVGTNDSTASGGSYVTFKAPSTGMNHIPDSQLPKGDATQATNRVLLDPGPIDKFSGDGSGNFRIVCAFSHMSYDDPLAYPGQPGAAHLHTFFGNTTTNYASTYNSLTAATSSSTCPGGGANRSAYWLPTLMNGSTPLVPEILGTYYKSELVPNASSVQDMPQGLHMIAGDKSNLTGQNNLIIYWACSGQPYAVNNTIPVCPAGNQVEMDVLFPQCWDGKNLDSANHISHLRYPGVQDPKPAGTLGNYGDGCSKETGYTTAIPALTVKAFWTVPAGGSANLRLSSDLPSALPGASAHADYMEGWDRTIEARFAQHCIREGRDTSNSLCDGQVLVSPNQFIFH